MCLEAQLHCPQALSVPRFCLPRGSANDADSSLRRRSGLCYLPSAALSEAVAREGLTLVAEGQTNFTRRAHPLQSPILACTRQGPV